MKIGWILIALFLLRNQSSECANILVYIQVPLYSHQTAFRPVWRELADRGHKITFITSEPMTGHENITNIHIANGKKIMESYNYYKRISTESFSMDMLNMFVYMVIELLEDQLAIPEMRGILHAKEKQFDLLITEFMIPPIGAAISKRLGIPFIGITSLDGHFLSHSILGNPTNPILYPSYDMPFKNKPTLIERLKSTLFAITVRVIQRLYIYPKLDSVLIRHFNETCSNLDESLRNVSMYFVNANPIFCTLRPLTPQTLNIGGFAHINKPQSLPGNLQKFLDSATEGCIYFSLGTNLRISKFPNQKLQVFIKAFEELPYKILWKFEEKLENISSNMMIEKWLPQQDILRHKNVKVFVTQGGLQSIEEAIYYHVPMVGLPIFGDQYNNINQVVNKGMGLEIDHKHLDVETFRRAIVEVITNSKYKDKVKYQAKLFLDQPMISVEKAVWWTEYVLRHNGGQHLRNPGIDLPFYQQYLLDVILIFGVVLIGFVYIIWALFKFIGNFVIHCVGRGRKLKVL